MLATIPSQCQIVSTIPAQNQMTVYIQKQLNIIKREHEEEIKNTYYLHKELTNEEYEKLIEELQQRIINIPPEYDNDELRKYYVNEVKEEIRLLKSDQKKKIDYTIYLARRDKQLNTYPTTNDELIEDLTDYIENQIAEYHKDLVDTYFDIFSEKIKKLCPDDKDYINTIRSVYMSKNSKKAMQIILNFFDVMKKSLYGFVMVLKRCPSMEYFRIFTLLKESIYKLIYNMHMNIYLFIESKIKYINDEEMSDSKTVKIYSEMCMHQLNQSLLNDLPPMLDAKFKDELERITSDLKTKFKQLIGIDYEHTEPKPLKTDVKDEVSYAIVSVNHKPALYEVIEPVKPKAIAPQFSDFVNQLPEDRIEAKDIVVMYNSYFGTNVSTISFGKLASSHKDILTKSQRKVKGKCITCYVKN